MASSSALFSITSSPNSIACATFLAYSFLSLSSRICKSSRSIAFGIVLKIYLIIQIKLSFLKLLLIIILKMSTFGINRLDWLVVSERFPWNAKHATVYRWLASFIVIYTIIDLKS